MLARNLKKLKFLKLFSKMYGNDYTGRILLIYQNTLYRHVSQTSYVTCNIYAIHIHVKYTSKHITSLLNGIGREQLYPN